MRFFVDYYQVVFKSFTEATKKFRHALDAGKVVETLGKDTYAIRASSLGKTPKEKEKVYRY